MELDVTRLVSITKAEAEYLGKINPMCLSTLEDGDHVFKTETWFAITIKNEHGAPEHYKGIKVIIDNGEMKMDSEYFLSDDYLIRALEAYPGGKLPDYIKITSMKNVVEKVLAFTAPV